jgi:hypothetical protein
MTPEQSAQKFDDRARNIKSNLEEMTIKAVLYVQGEIPSYPSPPAGSTYTRTGTLGRVITAFPGKNSGRKIGGSGGLARDASGRYTGKLMNDAEPLSRVEPFSGGAIGYIGGRLSYIGRVIDEDRQSSFFASYWWTLQDVLRGAHDGIIAIYRSDVLKIIRG